MLSFLINDLHFFLREGGHRHWAVGFKYLPVNHRVIGSNQILFKGTHKYKLLLQSQGSISQRAKIDLNIFRDHLFLYNSLINTLDGFRSLLGQYPVTWGCVNGRYKDRLWKIAIKWPLKQHTLCKTCVLHCISCLFIFMLVSLQNFAHLRVRAENVSILR